MCSEGSETLKPIPAGNNDSITTAATTSTVLHIVIISNWRERRWAVAKTREGNCSKGRGWFVD